MSGFHFFEDDKPPKEEVGKAQDPSLQSEDKEDTPEEYLTFRIGNDLFAVKLLDVREIIERPKVKPIPKCEAYFKGLFNLRGEIAGLIDLGEKFGLKNSSSEQEYSPVVLFNTKNGPLGIVVDEMLNVFECDDDMISNKASVKSKVPQQYLKGFIQKGEDIAILIDLQLVLDEDEITHFRKVREQS